MNQSRQTEEMVSVPVSDKNRRQINSGPATHHLALRALSTVEEDTFSISFNEDRRKTPSDRWHRPARSEKQYLKHNATIGCSFL